MKMVAHDAVRKNSHRHSACSFYRTREEGTKVTGLVEERLAMIAEAAYFRAEQRGFHGGAAEATRDWLEAEAEIDAWLAQRASEVRELSPNDAALRD